jgi:putative transposase
MHTSKFSTEQIVGIPKEHEAGAGTAELCRRHCLSQHTLYPWRQRYGGLERDDAARLKALADENARSKRLVAEQALDNQSTPTVLSNAIPARTDDTFTLRGPLP